MAWSDPLSFKIMPTGTGPNGTIATNLPTFSWNSMVGVVSYEVWLTDQTTGQNVIVPNLNTTTWTPTQPLALGDKYVWWIGAVNGQTIAWDNPLSFQSTTDGPWAQRHSHDQCAGFRVERGPWGNDV